MGINLGSFLSSITCGILGIVYGWKYGFGLAGIECCLALSYFFGARNFSTALLSRRTRKLKKSALGPINVEWACYLVGLLIIAVSMALVMNAHLIPDWFVGVLGIVVLIGLCTWSLIMLRGDERARMFGGHLFCAGANTILGAV